MKHISIFVTILSLFITPHVALATADSGGSADVNNVCGPEISWDMSYTVAMPVPGHDNLKLGYWAVGNGCDYQTDNPDIPSMCEYVEVGGIAFCGPTTWPTGDLDESTATPGDGCWCRRTKSFNYDPNTDTFTPIDSIGMAVLLFNMTDGGGGGEPAATSMDSGSSGDDELTTCEYYCAEQCAREVVNNYKGLRTAIMLLDAN